MMLKYLIEKEFKQIIRNSFLPRMILGLPIVALIIYPFAANFEVKNIALSVVDHDKSSYSQELIQKVQASGYFKITDVSDGYEEALRSIELDKSDIILEIPSNFQSDFIREKQASLMISANAVNGNKGGLGSAYLNGVINDFNADIRTELAGGRSASITQGIEVIPLYRYNPTLKYEVYMVPALMVMILAMICGFLPALNIVGEKESGTIEQINVTPIKKSTFILSKLIPYWIIGYLVLTIGMLIAMFFWKLIPQGSVLTIYFFATLFIVSFSGFGLVISNYALTIQQAMFMMFFFVLTFIFLSGLYTPVENMPIWAQRISDFSPLKYIIQVLRMVYLKGSGISDLLRPLAALVSFAIFFYSWAILSYRKTG
ncbi:ABC transporter permease [Lutimonas halocynthiae]|uniref:ABC transporter permease n=1 Tax=Lutimonas halocynthiae TaxID=1446477 RepID=UPI0025B589E8|nr:ABC transporter permease [Lutimonas halocynthiae]MDN3642483.1 ABC transporter permease [Lutimonas halocynthiae]